MHPMEANRTIQNGARWPVQQSDWVYTETPSGYKAKNIRTGEVWYQWESDQLYHPEREQHKLLTESIMAMICYAAVISAVVAAACIGILMIIYSGV